MVARHHQTEPIKVSCHVIAKCAMVKKQAGDEAQQLGSLAKKKTHFESSHGVVKKACV